MREARVAHLGLLDDDDRPRVLPVSYALAGDTLWSAVDHKPKRVDPDRLARVRFIRRRPEVSLCVDRYDDAWERLAWVQALGRADVVDHDDDAVAALSEKYRQYRARPPAGPLLRIEVERTLCWRVEQS